MVSADSTAGKDNDAGLTPGSIDATVAGPAVDARCGDLLVMRVKMLSGSTGYIELATGLSIP